MTAGNNISPADSGPNYHKYVLLLIGSLFLIRLGVLLVSPFNLHGDEAQYWAWSNDLDWGFFTKPPGIAAVIAAVTFVFGDAEWAVRMGSPLLHSITAYIIYRTTRFAFSSVAGFWAAAVYLLMPALWLSSTIISTDVPLLLCWAIALNAWVHLRSKPSWARAFQLGMALGLGFLSKYAMLFFLPAIFLVLMFDRPTRRALLGPRGFLVLAIFAAWAAPNMIWNMNHDFATLTHTAANADYAGGLPFHPLQLLEFALGQLAVFGPVSFGLLVCAALWAWKKHPDQLTLMLTIFAIMPLAIIAVQALTSRADLNWAVTAYIAAPILTAHFGVTHWPRMKNWMRYNLIFQTAICLIFGSLYLVPDIVNAAGRANDVKRLRGWPATAAQLSSVYDRGHEGRNFRAIAMDKRMHFYALNYYGLAETGPVYMWLYKSRPNNNHAEISHPLPAGEAPVLIINYHDKPDYISALLEDFTRLEPLTDLDIDLGGGKRRVLKLWAGYNYQPTTTR
ncbi:MAG: phospholipid carrier-dependent glycosyltransferase [Hellea sp.]|nr:phospholipid carrier-dependent glycosyltransferase [Hellea sp.]